MQESKKILMLGGAYSQIPAIKKAREMGYYVITCDYLPENPGHKYSDKYVNISTIEKEKVLELAKSEEIDGIIGYASDPSAPTAAYVASALKLPGSSEESVNILCRKDKFRNLQRAKGFNAPEYRVLHSQDDEVLGLEYPLVVKPLDMSGSRGVFFIESSKELYPSIKKAFGFGRVKGVIVEEYIDTPYCQLHGDGVVRNGKVEFLGLGDQRFRNTVPIGSSLPSKAPDDVINEAIKEVQRIVSESGFVEGCINAEVRIGMDGKPYVIEIGPRTGGNYVPELMETACSVPICEISIRQAMGEYYDVTKRQYCKPTFQYIIGSEQNGRFEEIYIDKYIEPKVKKLFCHKEHGDILQEYENSNGVVGVAIIQFDSFQEMDKAISNIREHIQVITF